MPVMVDWERFLNVTKGRKPIPLLVEAVGLLVHKGLALEIGCGAGVDTKYLAEYGFCVVAIDKDAGAVQQTNELCSGLAVEVLQVDVVDFDIEAGAYDLIFSWNTLPFLNKDAAGRVMHRIADGLKPGGLFVFGLFGPEDEWATSRSGMSFWTEGEMKEIFSGMEFVRLVETKKVGPAAVGGNKFWHKIQGIARKH